jgi:hypothetical protein
MKTILLLIFLIMGFVSVGMSLPLFYAMQTKLIRKGSQRRRSKVILPSSSLYLIKIRRLELDLVWGL